MSETRRMEKYIIKPKEYTGDLIYHDMKVAREMLGPLYAFVNKNIVEEADLTIFVHYIKKVPQPPPEYVFPHVHEVSQAYIFPTEGLKFEVTLEDEKYVVESPAAVFIPPGVKHSLKMLEGSGIEVCITRKAWYEDEAYK